MYRRHSYRNYSINCIEVQPTCFLALQPWVRIRHLNVTRDVRQQDRRSLAAICLLTPTVLLTKSDSLNGFVSLFRNEGISQMITLPYSWLQIFQINTFTVKIHFRVKRLVLIRAFTTVGKLKRTHIFKRSFQKQGTTKQGYSWQNSNNSGTLMRHLRNTPWVDVTKRLIGLFYSTQLTAKASLW